MVAFIGMGHLGSNFVQAMLKKGMQVNVWNRTPEKAKALEAHGAKAFDNVVDAVKGVDRIHLTLKDDHTVNDVLEQVKAGLKPGAMIIDHTTTSTAGAAERTEKWKQLGFTYLHAPVFMGPINALEGTGSMLVSGDQDVIKKIEPELSKMTGKVINFGTETNRAAGMKLVGNLFLISMTAGLSDVFALAKSAGIDNSDVATLFNAWNPAGLVPARIERMSTQNFDNPSWELSMARKDAGLMIQEVERGNGKAHLTAIPAIAAEMDRWISRGHGGDDWTVIAKDNVS